MSICARHGTSGYARLVYIGSVQSGHILLELENEAERLLYCTVAYLCRDITHEN